jgi:hypothetical protein
MPVGVGGSVRRACPFFANFRVRRAEFADYV